MCLPRFSRGRKHFLQQEQWKGIPLTRERGRERNPSSAGSVPHSPEWPKAHTVGAPWLQRPAPLVGTSQDGAQPPSETNTASLITRPGEHRVSLPGTPRHVHREAKQLV